MQHSVWLRFHTLFWLRMGPNFGKVKIHCVKYVWAGDVLGWKPILANQETLTDFHGEHKCGSTYVIIMLSNLKYKTVKKYIFCQFKSYMGQSDNHIGWATLMSLASIGHIDPKTIPWFVCEKYCKELAVLKNFLSRPFCKFFLLHPHENQSKFLG